MTEFTSSLQLSTIMELLEGSFYGMDLLKLHSVTTKLLDRMDTIEKVSVVSVVFLSYTYWTYYWCVSLLTDGLKQPDRGEVEHKEHLSESTAAHILTYKSTTGGEDEFEGAEWRSSCFSTLRGGRCYLKQMLHYIIIMSNT